MKERDGKTRFARFAISVVLTSMILATPTISVADGFDDIEKKEKQWQTVSYVALGIAAGAVLIGIIKEETKGRTETDTETETDTIDQSNASDTVPETDNADDNTPTYRPVVTDQSSLAPYFDIDFEQPSRSAVWSDEVSQTVTVRAGITLGF